MRAPRALWMPKQGRHYGEGVDTLIFGVLLTVALLIIFSKSRWLVIGSWAVGALAVLGLFAYHASDVLELSF